VSIKSKHAYDPQPVIEYARAWASETEERKYVAVDREFFHAVATQPDASESHWLVMPDGEVSAHVDTNRDGRYKYEATDR